MITKPCLIAPLAALGITFSSEIAFAAESNDAGFLITAWPLIALSIAIIIFRKQLIVQATPEQPDSDHHDAATEKTATAAAEKPATKAKNKSPAKKEKVAASPANIDLKDDSGQCQAATSKGTRCKRKSNLEAASMSLDGKTYDLNVCKQHHNDTSQVFSDFLK
jgi:hypothetical protein